ncbi:hypothetical protein C7212DRAFT_347086 [Tuber magnatum]|uniref:Uncharacterized protein n=1 Tax=Tuber magnatum TaxID=42249 RepID=A0A317SIP9_9PEZI|nr:hypothetical protein C7212DRAFT_347086 [Tuber magnatum]
MIPLHLFCIAENRFADISLQRPYYSWEITRRYNHAERLTRNITREVERVNAINSQQALLFLEKIGEVMNGIRAVKDECMARTLRYSEGYQRMGVLIKQLREVEVEVGGRRSGGFWGEPLFGGTLGWSGCAAPSFGTPPLLPPVSQQPVRGPVDPLVPNPDGVASERGLSRTSAIVRRRLVRLRRPSEERRRSVYTTPILSPRPNRTSLLGSRNLLLEDVDG